MVLVTGGTGLVGSHLLYRLLVDGHKVRAIYRRSNKLEKVKLVFNYYSDKSDELFNKIEWIEANINDIPALQDAFKGITHVYHCAAMVSFEPDKYFQLRTINIKGTANIVNLSLTHKVEKLCYVSSIAAIGHHENPEQLIDESTEWNAEEDHSVYSITKYGAELEVWRGTQEGLDAVVVNPGIILGPGYWKGGGSGSLFNRAYKGSKYYTEGITGYVDIWDVVKPMVQLMESEIVNEKFILVSENLSFKSFQTKVASQLNVSPPTKKASSLMLSLVWRLDWLRHKLLGKRRRLSKQAVKSIQSTTKYDNSKIENALNFSFKPIEKSIEEVCVLFLKDH